MKTTDTLHNTAAPSVTIALHNPTRGILPYIITLTGHKTVRSYPCRSMEKATRLLVAD